MKTYLAIVGCLVSMSLVGCQQQNEESLPQEENKNPTIQVKDSDPQQREDLTNSEVANHLANVASEVPNVYHATAVVAGPYAVVGIDVDKDLDRSRVGTIKYSVTEALQHDPYGKNAVVIADADGTERLKDLARKVQEGHPFQGIVDELSAVVGRYMPEFPINEDQPSEPNENKEVIPKDEQKKLDNVEERTIKQSHGLTKNQGFRLETLVFVLMPFNIIVVFFCFLSFHYNIEHQIENLLIPF
ncbi:YhcN/YlaJ family sporulation lipoprotein [Radiobacillus deserti]|uniref:YhcN/YlaJ family sporulation lipoprotein n=2 Tax=Radiobacillus deserti TaxID=2594883 RepID=A0A516KL71_9BACI|nr:YhcN/YlaJ family sporulation lipoprotein [Radiobacillus deserti]